MTTITACTRDWVMCSDSYWTDGDECGFTKKVFRIKGALLGGGGTASHLEKWFDAYRAGKAPARVGDVLVLRLSSVGIDYWNPANGWMLIEQPQWAIGTGGMAARGAMAAGATARQAVQIASDIDATTGGPVRTYRLNSRR